MPDKRKVFFRHPVTGAVSEVELWAVEAHDAVKRVPWEYSFSKTFADRPADAPDPKAKAAPLPAPGIGEKPLPPAATPADKERKKALVAEYKKLTGKKNGSFLSIEDLEAEIATAKGSAGGGAT